jgi:hypothetical protein
MRTPEQVLDDDEDGDEDRDDAFERLMKRAQKLHKRGEAQTVEQAFLRAYQDPKNSRLVAMTKERPVVPIEKAANDAHAELLVLAQEAYDEEKFSTPEIAYEAMLVTRSPEIRALVKRARGRT